MPPPQTELFDRVPLYGHPPQKWDGILSASAYGATAESLAISRLLGLGHKVAVPVVDDDGVDLVVDYRLAVQVKSCGSCRQRGGRGGGRKWEFEFRVAKKDGFRDASVAERGRSWAHIDFFLFWARVEGIWWVVPRSAFGSTVTRFRIAPGGGNDLPWREAWHLLRVVS